MICMARAMICIPGVVFSWLGVGFLWQGSDLQGKSFICMAWALIYLEGGTCRDLLSRGM